MTLHSILTNASGLLTLPLTMILFVSPIGVIRKIQQQKLLAPFSPYPFMLLLFNCVNWIIYGLMLEDRFIWGINLLGFFITGYFFTQTYFYSADLKKQIEIVLLAGCVIHLAFYSYMGIVVRDNVKMYTQLGYFGTSVGFSAFAAPLLKFYHVIRTRDPNCMSFGLSIATVFSCANWAFYGYLKGNGLVVFNNLVPLALGVIQLLLFAIYSPRHFTIAYWKEQRALKKQEAAREHEHDAEHVELGTGKQPDNAGATAAPAAAATAAAAAKTVSVGKAADKKEEHDDGDDNNKHKARHHPHQTEHHKHSHGSKHQNAAPILTRDTDSYSSDGQ